MIRIITRPSTARCTLPMYIGCLLSEPKNQVAFDKLHSQHWQIEQYHRTIKQVCNIESFPVRGKTAVKNHLLPQYVVTWNPEAKGC